MGWDKYYFLASDPYLRIGYILQFVWRGRTSQKECSVVASPSFGLPGEFTTFEGWKRNLDITAGFHPALQLVSGMHGILLLIYTSPIVSVLCSLPVLTSFCWIMICLLLPLILL